MQDLELGPLDMGTIRVGRGRQFYVIFTVRDASGSALDLSSYSGSAANLKQKDGTLIVDLAPSITNAAAGQVTIDATIPADAKIGRHPWDIYITLGGKKYELAYGFLLVTEVQTP